MKWFTWNRLFLGVIGVLVLAIVVSQWHHGEKLEGAVDAYADCVVDHDCKAWCDLYEEDRARYNMQWASANPVECTDADTGEVSFRVGQMLRPVDEVIEETPAAIERSTEVQKPILDPVQSLDAGPADIGFLQFLNGNDLP